MRPKWTAAAIAVFVATLTGIGGAPAQGAGLAVPSEQDKNYLITAHQFNLAQIDLGQLARLKGTAAAVRDLASKIVTDHLTLDEALIPVANQFGVTLPASPDDAQKVTQSQLEAMPAGADFDREWSASELSTHTTAINQGQAEISGGTEPAVIKLAQDAAAILAVHHGSLMRASTAASPPSHVDSGTGGLADPRRTLIPLAITAAGLLLIMAGVTLRRRSSL